MKINLDHLNLTVDSFEESAKWYSKVFGFEIVERGEREGLSWGILKLGQYMLCLFEKEGFSLLSNGERAEKKLHGMNHFAIAVDNIEEWENIVSREKLEVGYGGVVDYPHSKSWYVTDPTGYEIEVAYWKTGIPTF